MGDGLCDLRLSRPHLTRSALHRCLQRHGLLRLPEAEGERPGRERFRRYPIGFFHLDIAGVQTAEGRRYLFVALGRTSGFAVSQRVETVDRRTARVFLEHLPEAVPYRIHKVRTGNGIHVAAPPRNRNPPHSRQLRVDMICDANGIAHRLMKPSDPWTSRRAERMNCTIRKATVKRLALRQS